MEHSPIQIPPPEALAAVPAPVIAAAIDRLIEALDLRDGDLDLESNGDERDGNPSEDEFMDHGPGYGAGCDIADPGELVGDERDTDNAEDEHFHGAALELAWTGGPGCDVADAGENAAPEWISLGRHKNPNWDRSLPHEDAEDDDQDQCLASDDDPARRIGDRLPGDSLDTEANGDEGDYSNDGGPPVLSRDQYPPRQIIRVQVVSPPS